MQVFLYGQGIGQFKWFGHFKSSNAFLPVLIQQEKENQT